MAFFGTKTSASSIFYPQTDGQSDCSNHRFEQILHAHIHIKPLLAYLDAVLFTEFEINT